MRAKALAALAAALLAALLGATGCGAESAKEAKDAGRHEAIGTVTDVDAESHQVMVDHEDIPGLMPAMTMSFDVPDDALLSRLAPGQRIRFTLEHGEGHFRIVSAEVIAEGEAGRSGGGLLESVTPADEPAPPFSLTDQDGHTVTLASLRGKVVLLDFIYTHCPGPCPILTSVHVQVQRELPEALKGRVQLVSITLDPERDTPEVMRAYAEKRGADFSNWSFLSGSREQIEPVLKAYGVGTAPGEGIGEIAHVVVSFLIDDQGNIVERYFGVEHTADDLVRDLESHAPETVG
jgi:protein SCO1/2